MRTKLLAGCAVTALALAIMPALADDTARYSVDPEAARDAQTGITLPQGFVATVFADELGRARHITVRDNGDVYVMLRQAVDGHGIVALRDTTGDGRADRVERFGDFTGTGIKWHNGMLYASSDREVFRFAFSGNELVPSGAPETIVTGFPEQRGHGAKPFVFDGQGNIYVNSGAPSNNCETELRTAGSPGQRPCPELERGGGIWRFAEDVAGQDQMADGFHYATGIRHAVAIDWSPHHNSLYVVQHGRDQLDQFWGEHFTPEMNAELPAEEFLKVSEGSVFGWPYTYYDHHQGYRVIAPEYGGDGRKPAESGRYEDPIQAFPAHWAPNDLHFYRGDAFPEFYRNGAFIVWHGSWNRMPFEQRGYKVTFTPMGDDGKPAGDWIVFADGFAGERPIESPRDAEYRPMGLAEGSDGALYVSDSQKGRVWRITWAGE
jgi:glucose/arabinose dehydrogenase